MRQALKQTTIEAVSIESWPQWNGAGNVTKSKPSYYNSLKLLILNGERRNTQLRMRSFKTVKLNVIPEIEQRF